MFRIFKKFLSDKSGGMVVYLGIAIIPIAITIGSAVDYSKVAALRTKAQASIDSAVLAAASTPEVENAERKKIATDFFRSNAALNGIKNVDDITPNTVISNGEVSSSVTLDVSTAFLSIVGIAKVPVSVNAAAAYNEEEEASGKSCVFVERYKVFGSFGIDGECGFHVSGPADDVFDVAGSFANFGTETTTHGGFIGTAAFNPVQEYQPQQSFGDPLSKPFELDENSLCADSIASNRVVINDGQTKTISDGVFCREWTLNGGTLILEPGTYILKKPIVMNSRYETIIKGDGVTLVFADEARLDVHSQFTGNRLGIYITPPTYGDFKDIAIYQLPTAANNTNTIHGALDFSEGFEGIVYMPNMDFTVTGSFAFKTRADQVGVFVARNFHHVAGAGHFHTPKLYQGNSASGGSGEDRHVYLKK